MTVVCRKTGFPIRCRHCGELSGRPNGCRKALAKDPVQQVRCSLCKRHWTLRPGKDEVLFRGRRLHLDGGRLLRSFALMVLGLPMERVERVLDIKAETMKGKLIRLLDNYGWEALDAELQRRFNIPQFYRSEFRRAIVDGRAHEKSAFRCWAKEFGRMDPSDRARLQALIRRIVKGVGPRHPSRRLMGAAE